MSDKTEGNPNAVAIAVGLLNAALIARCQEMMARLTTRHTFVAEVSAFRRAIFDSLDAQTFKDLDPGDLEIGKQLARDDIDAVCAVWLLAQEVAAGKPGLN